jgi:outer membrane protein assembly factor BamB
MDQTLSQIQQNPYQFMQHGPPSLVVAEGKVFSRSMDASQINQGMPPRLWCRDAAGGPLKSGRNDKLLWDSANVPELANWQFSGQPLPHRGRLYVTAHNSEKPGEVHVLALHAADGKLLWSRLVGTRQAAENNYYNQRLATPRLLLHDGKLYVDTHSGAVAELAAESGALHWGFQYDCPVPDANNYYGDMGLLVTEGAPRVLGTALYFKGMRSDRFYALDLAGPSLVFKREIDPPKLLISIEPDRYLFTGDELTSIDARTRRLQWSTPLPVGTGWIRPVVTKSRIYQFTPRGIFEFDKATGDRLRVFRGADLESLGGEMFVTPQALITVSNLAITAYPLVRDEG